MTIAGFIFDIDGTLVDTNAAHVEAWRRAFAHLGHEVPSSRLALEIGKGGDKLVPSVLGQAAERREGDALRRRQKQEYLALSERQRFQLFPGAQQVFTALRDRGIRTALATSSDEKNLEATVASAGVDLRILADVVVTRSKGQASKPAPDLVVHAVKELGLPPAACAMVGDTVHDGEACQRAGVAFLGVLSGPASEDSLRGVGARSVWRDVGDMLNHLDDALETAVLDPAAHQQQSSSGAA
jgi:HAD superfamily hydrolase (TIGR01509 family)